MPKTTAPHGALRRICWYMRARTWRPRDRATGELAHPCIARKFWPLTYINNY